jgi:outer membrane biosynthesis protein TonB
MSAEHTLPSLDATHALRPSLQVQVPQRQTAFWLSLLAAAMVHAALLGVITRAPPRTIGAEDGSESAIDVELVDAGELRAMSAPTSAPSAPPQQTPAAQPAPPPKEPQPEPTPEAQTEPQAEPSPQKSATLPALEAEEPQPSPPAAVLPKPAPKSSEQEPSEAKKQTESKPQPEPKPKPEPALKPPAKLDLSVPFDMAIQGGTSGGSESAATRPPGITRSGENDRFGRDVIRALKKTMPPLESVTGKVRVRIFLNERGNVAWVRLVQGSGDRGLDDNWQPNSRPLGCSSTTPLVCATPDAK